MIAIDTDVLAIYHIFRNAPRADVTNQFFDRIAGHIKAVTVFNALEFYGILVTTTGKEIAFEIFHRFLSSADINVIFPELLQQNERDFWAALVSECFSRIQRGIRLGDAAILWTLETNENLDSFVTWNTKHFTGKTPLKILTPSDFL